MPPPPRAASPPLGSHSTPIVGHQTLGAPHKAPSTLLSFAVQSRAAKEEEEGGLKEAVQSRDAWLLVPNGVGGSGGSFAGIPPGRSPRKGCAPISPTLQESSSLNPRQMNDASSNKPRYHDINNIYFQAKPQPGLLIPVIKANGSCYQLCIPAGSSLRSDLCVHPFPSRSPRRGPPRPPRAVSHPGSDVLRTEPGAELAPCPLGAANCRF